MTAATFFLQRIVLGASLLAASVGVAQAVGAAWMVAMALILLSMALCLSSASLHVRLRVFAAVTLTLPLAVVSAWQLLAWSGMLPSAALPAHSVEGFRILAAPCLSPVTMLNALLLSLAMGLLQLRVPRGGGVAGSLALGVVIVTMVLILGYAYGTPLFAEQRRLSVELSVALAFFGLGVGVIATAGTEHFPLRPFVGTSTQARLLRAFLPLSVVALAADRVVHRLLPLFIEANPALTSMISTLVLLAAISVTVSHIAAWIGRTMDRAEAERHHAVEALHASEAKFRSLVEHSLVGIYLIQRDRLVYVNPRMADIFGSPQQELMGSKSVFELIVEADRMLVADNLLKPLRGEMESVHYTCRGQRRDGTVIDIEMHGTRTELDGAPAIIGTVLDITENMRLEREWQEQSEALEHSNLELVQQQKIMQDLLEDLHRSKEHLAEQGRELEARNKRLNELMLLKDEFVAKVSHELRTPLTSIKEGISLMRDGALGHTNAEQQDFLKTIDGDIDRLTELITNMLDLSKIEAGRMQLSRTMVDLRALINSLVRSYQPMVGRRRIHIVCAENPPAFADPHGVVQILTNLFSNALKCTPEEGTITFRITRQDAAVAIAVEDTGCGIAREDLPKLFRKFCEVEPHGGVRRGTGLGLAVCKELAELHGGRIEVTSEVERGTTFTVWLPVYTDAVALTLSFQDIMQRASVERAEGVALMAIQGAGLVSARIPAPSRLALERVADVVRQHLHRGDVVLVLPPTWIVVMAVADTLAMRAIVRRLQSVLPAEPLRCGVAMSPAEGTQVNTLLALAMSRVDTAAASRLPQGSAAEPVGPEQERHEA